MENLMEWILLPLKRYADFSGRSRRKEFWSFILAVAFVAVLLAVAGVVIGSGAEELGTQGVPLAILLVLFGAALLIPSIAVQVRRFHDQDKSGWFVLINFVPYLGGLVVLVFMLLEGTRGPNRFGEDPKA
jgi:uncharacterized membrane protein YhaH (DUF805 family)